jgi:hypothetical protein
MVGLAEGRASLAVLVVLGLLARVTGFLYAPPRASLTRPPYVPGAEAIAGGDGGQTGTLQGGNGTMALPAATTVEVCWLPNLTCC